MPLNQRRDKEIAVHSHNEVSLSVQWHLEICIQMDETKTILSELSQTQDQHGMYSILSILHSRYPCFLVSENVYKVYHRYYDEYWGACYASPSITQGSFISSLRQVSPPVVLSLTTSRSYSRHLLLCILYHHLVLKKGLMWLGT